jgi:hypothetical protein
MIELDARHTNDKEFKLFVDWLGEMAKNVKIEPEKRGRFRHAFIKLRPLYKRDEK